ncbi:MAG: GDP-L-fucose synthase [Planctomycetota bacterium]
MADSTTLQSTDRIFVAGHRGMVGAATVRQLQAKGYEHLLTRTRDELDLCHPQAVDQFFAAEQPDVVVIAAAKVGGILANNTYPVEFLNDNLAIASNLIRSAFEHKSKRVLFLGSSCIYPREAPQPMQEDCLLTGPLEKTNEAYALAKICGLKLCQYYRQQYGVMFHSAMPTNLYGPGDNYHPKHSHVLPALIRKVHEAKQRGDRSIVLWGTGSPKREFLHVDDLAAAIHFLLQQVDPPPWVNVGTGLDVSIKELAEIICETLGFEGEIEYDTSKPDGTPRKLMDVSLMTGLGWKASISLRDGIRQAYGSFLAETEAGVLRAV